MIVRPGNPTTKGGQQAKRNQLSKFRVHGHRRRIGIRSDPCRRIDHESPFDGWSGRVRIGGRLRPRRSPLRSLPSLERLGLGKRLLSIAVIVVADEASEEIIDASADGHRQYDGGTLIGGVADSRGYDVERRGQHPQRCETPQPD